MGPLHVFVLPVPVVPDDTTGCDAVTQRNQVPVNVGHKAGKASVSDMLYPFTYLAKRVLCVVFMWLRLLVGPRQASPTLREHARFSVTLARCPK